MAMESFYGGRQGASFVIVRSFDAIDNTISGNEYVSRYYAVNNNNVYVWENNNFIERSSANYNDYSWVLTVLNGDTVTTTDGDKTLETKSAEGMIQFFQRGGDTTGGEGGVNYGEYVIIDTPNKSNPDNGKVFRRGMDKDNELGGAEYIGQIVGPKGDTPKIDMDHYETVSVPGSAGGSFTLGNGDLVPGYIQPKPDSEEQYKDTIDYAYVNIKDEYGNILGALIGFRVPYLVMDFEAEHVSAYYTDPLAIKDPEQYDEQTGTWQHPFYQKWQLKIPHGIHGVNATDFQVLPTLTMPIGFKEKDAGSGTDYQGALVWLDADCTSGYRPGSSGTQVRVNGSKPVLYDVDYDLTKPGRLLDPTQLDQSTFPPGQDYYVHVDDCYMQIIRYKETNFDNSEEGTLSYIKVGDANFIYKLTLSNNGILTAYYTAETNPKEINNNIKWIGDEAVNKNIDIDNDGTITIYYNTGAKDIFNKKLAWIEDVEVADDGTLEVDFNNDKDPKIFTKKLKWVDDIKINTTEEGGLEGSGNQKVHVTYNTEEEGDIGLPLNYIIDTIITPGESHLLVYYSDKAKREQEGGSAVYHSNKLNADVSGWVDLGKVKGEPGGIHILKDVDSLNDLKSGGNWIKPEDLAPASPEHAGWAVSYTPVQGQDSTIYFYDYDQYKWYPIGTISSAAVDPSYAIAKCKGDSNFEPDNTDPQYQNLHLNTNGFWFAETPILTVH